MLLRRFFTNKMPIGFTWENEQINLVELNKIKNQLIARSWQYPVASILDKETGLINSDKLSDFLNNLKIKRSWSNRRVIAALPNSETIIRFVELPKTSTGELEETILWKAKEAYGITKEEYSLDYLIVNSAKGNKSSLNILLFAISKKEALALYHGFSKSGFNLEAIDIAPLAFRRALRGNLGCLPKGLTLFADLGQTSTQLIFQTEKDDVFIRNVKLNWQKSPNNKNWTLQTKNIVKEIRRTLDYLTTILNDVFLSAVIIGGVCRDLISFEILEEEFKIPIKKGIPGMNIIIGPFPEPLYTTALGLALGGIKS